MSGVEGQWASSTPEMSRVGSVRCELQFSPAFVFAVPGDKPGDRNAERSIVIPIIIPISMEIIIVMITRLSTRNPPSTLGLLFLQRVPPREQPLFHGFDFCHQRLLITPQRMNDGEELTESDVPRVVPAHGEIPRHTPQVIDSNIPPSSSRFTIAVQTPNLLHFTPKFFPKDLPESISEVAKPSGKNNEICVERAPVFELQPGLGELLDGGVVLEFDFSVNYHLAGSDVCAEGYGQERFG